MSVTPSIRRERRCLDQSSGHRHCQRGHGVLRLDAAGFLCRLAATIPGVTVNSVTLDERDDGDDQHLDGQRDARTEGRSPSSILTHSGDERRDPPRDSRVRSSRSRRRGRDQRSAASTVSGWAVDGTAATGTGVDAVHVYAYTCGRQPHRSSAPRPTACLARHWRVAWARASRASGYTPHGADGAAAGSVHDRRVWAQHRSRTFNASASVAVTLTALGRAVRRRRHAGEQHHGQRRSRRHRLGARRCRSGGGRHLSIAGGGEGRRQIFVGRAVFIRGARPDVQAPVSAASGQRQRRLGLHGADEHAAEPGQRRVRLLRLRGRIAPGCRRCSARGA